MKTDGNEVLRLENLPRWTVPAAAALMVAVACAAAWSAKLGSRYDGDSFLPVLISLQRLTVYYWGQNRFGNLAPWLASGVHDVMFNFRLQVFLRALGTAAIPLPVLLFLGVRKRLFAAYALSLGLMLLPFSAQANFLIWVDIEPYGQSMLLLLGALAAYGGMRKGRPPWRNALCAAGALVAATLAFFVNTSLLIFALPLWAGAAVMSGRGRDWGFAGMLAAAFALGSAPSRWFGSEYHLNYDYNQMAFAAENFSRGAARIGSVSSWWILAGCIAAALCGLWVIQRGWKMTDGTERTEEMSPWLARLGVDARVWRAGLLLGVAAFYLALVANMGWVKENDFAFRYFMFPLLVFPVVCAGAVVEAVARRAAGIVGTAAALAVMAAVVLSKLAPFGGETPFLGATHREDTAATAELAREYSASFITGDYYLVWPSVFYAIHLRQMAGDPGALQVYGLAPKGEALRDAFTDFLRSSRRVVMIGAGAEMKDCYEESLHNDIVDWPERVSLLKTGKLPSGATYSVVAFERGAPGEAPLPQAGAAAMPARGTVMLHMLKLNPGVARWEGETIKVAATGKPQPALSEAYWNFPPGKYRASFEISAQPDPAQHTPLLLIEVTDRLRAYARGVVDADALEVRDGGVWASILFEVPAGEHTADVDVQLLTSGRSEFEVKNMDISRAP